MGLVYRSSRLSRLGGVVCWLIGPTIVFVDLMGVATETLRVLAQQFVGDVMLGVGPMSYTFHS